MRLMKRTLDWKFHHRHIICTRCALVQYPCISWVGIAIVHITSSWRNAMPGPIRDAKKFSEYESFNELGKALLDHYPSSKWGMKNRSLGNKLGELDRGTTTWWRNNPDKAKCLAELLEITLEDLGLHEKAGNSDFHFLEFPELPPLDLKRDDGWKIGVEELDPLQDVGSEGFRKETLDDWLGPYPAWIRHPPIGFNWLKVSDDLSRQLLVQKLRASGRYEVVVAETLAAVAIRLKNSKPIIVALEKDEGGDDLAALVERPEDAGILIIASFMFEPREEMNRPGF
ncbi:hypothetical protein EZJ19_08375 [Parasulfuritortus cantonensis]|uniref:Uncharacterized protein n=1 Tax=Parasulfuritortus cantonensis TaxID=2528202 RepID=A0A4R1BCZ5_9PROT|nr:hypothetical protein [Parasulfuritortus cantonensis]TCJ14894.1 hypothetical protein EZJ19_08375 [Parasulfuritortus cantonensis]